MQAQDIRLTQLLEGPKQFIVPVFQRDYSWGTKDCLQLWKDIVRVGSDQNAKAHFIGSIVYIAAEDPSATQVTRWLLIDGQQRLTTLTILLAAFRNRLDDTSNDEEINADVPSKAELEDYYLRNVHGKADRKHKLHLRRADLQTIQDLLDGRSFTEESSERIRENFEFFDEQLENADLAVVFRGIKKLVAVDVSLTRGQDDPQMIFESLNSTGVSLTEADLIRNFVLMRQEESTQTRLYHEYWQPMEILFGNRYRSDFDKFVRDYLTLKMKPSKQIRADQIYHNFRTYFYKSTTDHSVEEILQELKRFGEYYVAFSLAKEKNEKLREAFRRLRLLIEVSTPTLLTLYDYYDRTKTLSADEFVEACEVLESYVFRRSVCDMQTRSLGQIFANLAYRIKESNPLVSLKVALHRQGKKQRFPHDAEFREALETRNIFDMRNCHYLLDRLENGNSHEKIDTAKLTIEHVMPQNEDMPLEWRQALGSNWKQTQEAWLHRLGNITLTGYNSSYSDKSFYEKKTMPNGFDVSPLRLNKFIREQEIWTEKEIEVRGKKLAEKALKIWRPLTVDIAAVQSAELEERKIQAARYSIENLEFDEYSRHLFDQIRPRVMALGEDVAELCGAKSVTYRVYDFFLEIIPRKNRLTLLINLDYDECDDPTDQATDADNYAFIIYASEKGGVLFNLKEETSVEAAMYVIEQAYNKL